MAFERTITRRRGRGLGDLSDFGAAAGAGAYDLGAGTDSKTAVDDVNRTYSGGSTDPSASSAHGYSGAGKFGSGGMASGGNLKSGSSSSSSSTTAPYEDLSEADPSMVTGASLGTSSTEPENPDDIGHTFDPTDLLARAKHAAGDLGGTAGGDGTGTGAGGGAAGGAGGGGGSHPAPLADTAKSDDNTLLYVGGALAALAAGSAIFIATRKKKPRRNPRRARGASDRG